MPHQAYVILFFALLSVCVALISMGISNLADHCASVCAGDRAEADQVWWLTLKQRAFAVVVGSSITAAVLIVLSIAAVTIKFLAGS